MATATKKGTKTPTVTVTVAMFDTHRPIYRAKRDNQAIKDWQPLTLADYRPNGGTPLLDATAQFIAHLDKLQQPGVVTIGCLADESGSMGGNERSVVAGINEFVGGMADVEVDPETDGKVLAVILTDGLENSSREVNNDQLRAMVTERESRGWTFIYLGANQDAWGVARQMGTVGATASSYNYTSSPVGTQSAIHAATMDSAEWLGSNKLRQTTKEEMGGMSERTVAESGEVTDEAESSDTPTEGSSYDIKAAIEKAKEI
jgi:hypothetical protein